MHIEDPLCKTLIHFPQDRGSEWFGCPPVPPGGSSKLGPQNEEGVCRSGSRTARVGRSCPVRPSGGRWRSVRVLGNTDAVPFLGSLPGVSSWGGGRGGCFAFHRQPPSNESAAFHDPSCCPSRFRLLSHSANTHRASRPEAARWRRKDGLKQNPDPRGETYCELWEAFPCRVVVVGIVVTATHTSSDCCKLPAGPDLLNAHNPSEKRAPPPAVSQTRGLTRGEVS